MKVIGIVGMPASGKGEFSKIAEARGIPVVVMGDVIRAAVVEAGLEMTDANMGKVSSDLRAEHGMGAIALKSIPFVEEQDAPVVIIDGIRGSAEVEIFREHFPTFLLVAVTASFETRFGRLKNRGRADDVDSAEALRARDERELGWGLGEAMTMADVEIANEGGMEEYAAKVARLIGAMEGCR
ncbi:flagellar hook-basal body complex protein FliE [Methanofollis formosanus]|uniref:UPF0200 protein E2N92_01925 n=1 Tax=Methanofollis formosanus TaxID=299308 RepID=A0A8G0ZZ71_9EURY|nr:AAA family ATPase [Methanofollis formosanus]QYZ78275.1 flagellar hook-basal body complex protein FliE [Methanofollis formosanus]